MTPTTFPRVLEQIPKMEKFVSKNQAIDFQDFAISKKKIESNVVEWAPNDLSIAS